MTEMLRFIRKRPWYGPQFQRSADRIIDISLHQLKEIERMLNSLSVHLENRQSNANYTIFRTMPNGFNVYLDMFDVTWWPRGLNSVKVLIFLQVFELLNCRIGFAVGYISALWQVCLTFWHTHADMATMTSQRSNRRTRNNGKLESLISVHHALIDTFNRVGYEPKPCGCRK